MPLYGAKPASKLFIVREIQSFEYQRELDRPAAVWIQVDLLLGEYQSFIFHGHCGRLAAGEWELMPLVEAV